MPNNNSDVVIYYGSQSDYDSATKNDNAIYFITDQKRVYVGTQEYTRSDYIPIVTGKTNQIPKFTADGKIESTGFTIEKSVPSDAKFTDTTYEEATQISSGLLSADDKKKLDGIIEGATKTTVDSTLDSASTNPVQNKVVKNALDSKLDTSLKGTANGVAELDANGKVLSSQLPSYVDDVIEGYYSDGKFYSDNTYTNIITGESGKIYINLDNDKTYRWTGSVYTVISETIALGETLSTAYRGDRGKIAYDHSQVTSGNPHNVTKEEIGLENVENKSSATIRGELTKNNVTTALGYTPPTSDTTYSDATTNVSGLMSSADKSKLDGIAVEANKTIVDSVLSTTSENPVQNKVVSSALEDIKGSYMKISDNPIMTETEYNALSEKTAKLYFIYEEE